MIPLYLDLKTNFQGLWSKTLISFVEALLINISNFGKKYMLIEHFLTSICNQIYYEILKLNVFVAKVCYSENWAISVFLIIVLQNV